SSDFIVGFPGESDADFRDTMRLVEAVRFAQAYSFKYSPRPGTPAAAIQDAQVPDAVKAERLAELQAALLRDQRAFNEACTGRTMAVLFDRPGSRPGQLAGRSPYMQAVHAPLSGQALGRILDVRIERASASSLGARPLDGQADAA
ncbi:MAG: TRAM domain-containing protein, partial [Alphaproteobacteria bacterium]|nr:TRAM domain-containing protein [Alphaproteobacteria bacterium]